jgi:dTDP-4-amino-4,6-dideoxygalactose transaminase
MITRRSVLATAAVSIAAKPALLGGERIRSTPWPSWPIVRQEEETAVLGALRSGRWGRGNGKLVDAFEAQYAKLTGSPHCLATSSGTSALVATLGALDLKPGDEVIVPPYTFVATVNAVMMYGAKPVFVDSELETFQIDASKVEAAITPRTRAIMPVHLGGAAADMDTILAVAKRKNLPVIEDACQAHLGQWRGRQVGTWGLAGCFSFQASKNLNSGEGGAILTGDPEFLEKCFTFHNNGRGRKTPSATFSYDTRGSNLRLTEFQAALLMAQMTRVEAQAATRSENAAHLTKLLKEIPGVSPQRLHFGCTRNAWHLYMFRYEGKLPRDKFVSALRAEGVPCSTGYVPLNREPFLGKEQTESCPVNDRLCSQAVWFTQTMLLDTKQGMDQIAQAIRKIEGSADKISRA